MYKIPRGLIYILHARKVSFENPLTFYYYCDSVVSRKDFSVVESLGPFGASNVSKLVREQHILLHRL